LGHNIFKGPTAEESRQRILKQAIPDFRMLDSRVDEKLNVILQRCLTRDLSKRFETADELMYELEYYIYHGGYGPTNETMGKFIRELFGQATPKDSLAPGLHGQTEILEHTARLRAKI
jgi:serine/threonine-protein kinase